MSNNEPAITFDTSKVYSIDNDSVHAFVGDPNRFDGGVVGGHFKKDEEGNRTHLYVVYIDNGGNYYHYETPLDPELYEAGRKQDTK